jgi:hypothetical protein
MTDAAFREMIGNTLACRIDARCTGVPAIHEPGVWP